jgi:hypothetical protein
MKKRWCIASVWALALAGLLLLAGPALAQNQGGGQGGKAVERGGLCTGGPGGTCAVHPPVQQGQQKCPTQPQQCSQAPQGANCSTEPKTQANPPAPSH